MGADKKRQTRNLSIDISVSPDVLQPCERPEITANGVTAGIYPSEIWAEVDRIRMSSTMSGCNRPIQFLKFVVDATLRGEAAHLKETTIGVAVFGRSPDYDPKVDTVVRSHAWRLRSKLKKYYASEGRSDRIVIDIPLGHYVPVFYIRELTEMAG